MFIKPKEPFLKRLTSASTEFMGDCQDASSENGTQLYGTERESLMIVLYKIVSHCVVEGLGRPSPVGIFDLHVKVKVSP
jgi:hypothetical protein